MAYTLLSDKQIAQAYDFKIYMHLNSLILMGNFFDSLSGIFAQYAHLAKNTQEIY